MSSVVTKWVSGVSTAALVLAALVLAPASASAASGEPVPDGIYLTTPWATPGSTVWVEFVGSTGCDTDVTRSWAFVSSSGTTALSSAGFGEGLWIERGVALALPLGQSAPVSGNLVLTCTPTGGGSAFSVSLPLTISQNQPASVYHSSTGWTWGAPGAIEENAAVTVSALGFAPGEATTVSLVNERIAFADGTSSTGASVAAPVTADGEGAVTTVLNLPAGWTADDPIDLVIAGSVSRYLLISGAGTPTNGDPSIALSSTEVAFPGSAVAISAAGFEAGETVSVALHSASARAVQIGSLVADSSGAISGRAYVPASTSPGEYRVWAGARTISYLLLNAPLTVGAAPATTRISGVDRFATAVAISQRTAPFGPGEGTVYLANGLNFPDALSSGALAAQIGAPVLLTAPGALSDAVRAELVRLHPATVKIVGGPTSVGANVFTAVEGLGFEHETVRIAGSDRFETNRLLISDAMSSAKTVYVSTGFNFPDALAAAPAAAAAGGAVVLVNGGGSALDQSTLDLLTSLGVEDVRVIGGVTTVSQQIENQLNTLYPGHVVRLAGSDRYETAALIVAAAFSDGASEVILASGANFPDALAASALGRPMLTSAPSCVPGAILVQLGSLQPGAVTLIGDPKSLSNAVKGFAHC